MSIDDNISIVHWTRDNQPYRCGYCKNPTGNLSDGMWAEELTVDDYQNLIDRGWRRSGKYCYKPVMNEICCPQYTIKCDTLNFSLSKSQKKIIKKFNKFLNDGQSKSSESQPNSSASIEDDYSSSNVQEMYMPDIPTIIQQSSIDKSKINNSQLNTEVEEIDSLENESKNVKDLSGIASSSIDHTNIPTKIISSGKGANPDLPVCKKAKLLRLERKQEKLLKRGMSLDKLPIKNEQKSLEEFLTDINKDSKHKLRLKLISVNKPKSNEWLREQKIEFELYKKYQMLVHLDPPNKCTMAGFFRFLVATPLKITLQSTYSIKNSLLHLSSKLYKKYQMMIHNDEESDCSENEFISWLVDSPLKPVNFSTNSSNAEVSQYGSYHQQYWLDDKLIAVGVIDILPKCVSSVYFFYDPDHRDLTLGTYGSLREIEFTTKLHQIVPSIRYYYMGFYIHSCPKMRYKGRLSSSYLLCPETYSWFPIDLCLNKLNVNKYSRLNDDTDAVDENCCSPTDIDGIKVFYKDKLYLYKSVKRYFSDFYNFAMLIGRKSCRTMLFVINDF